MLISESVKQVRQVLNPTKSKFAGRIAIFSVILPEWNLVTK
jgi:hypothetical protein